MLNATPARRGQRGLSIVELMIGVAIGLIVLSGALSLFSTNLNASRRLQAETRLNQDLRAAADMVARDLRRAGYWGNAIQGTLAQGVGSVTVANPYSAVAAASANVGYAFSRGIENDTLDTIETFGFRLQSGVVEMQTSAGAWQGVTDPTAVNVLDFTITPTTTALPLGHLCPKTCAPNAAGCPVVQVRRYDIRLEGQSQRFADMRRTLPLTVRVRNERMEGQCPA